jgi:OOP family OmpA-OmpF porin
MHYAFGIKIQPPRNIMNTTRATSINLGLLLAISFGTSPAVAGDDGFYLGGAVGGARANFDVGQLLVNAPAGTAFTNDTSKTGWKVFGGYQFDKYFGAELSYVNLGNYGFSGKIPPVTFSGNVKINGLGIAATGTLPLDKGFSLFGKIGGFYSQEKAAASATFFGTSATASGEDDRWVAQFGLGVKYAINQNVSVRLEAERYQDMGSNLATVRADVTLYSIGLSYGF